MATAARYCPFCGARLRDDGDPLAGHLRDRRECAEAFESWDAAGPTDGTELEEGKARRMRSFLMWIVIASVLLYALLIAMDPLLGVLAAGIVYFASRFTS